MIVGLSIFLVAALLLAANGKQLFPGWPRVWVFGVIATAALIYSRYQPDHKGESLALDVMLSVAA